MFSYIVNSVYIFFIWNLFFSASNKTLYVNSTSNDVLCTPSTQEHDQPESWNQCSYMRVFTLNQKH